MSIVYCSYCGKHIDTDYDAEHFYDENLEYDEDYCIKKQEDKEKDKNAEYVKKNQLPLIPKK